MSMSRKHYVAIADAIKHEYTDDRLSPQARLAFRNLTETLCAVFEDDNSEFNRARFETAVFGTPVTA